MDDPAFMADFSFADYGIDSNSGFLLLLTMFVSAMIGLLISVVFIQNRPFVSLINPTGRIRFDRIVIGFLFGFQPIWCWK